MLLYNMLYSSKPYSSLIIHMYIYICIYIYQVNFGVEMEQCGGCRFARYCSRQCQRRAWRHGYHAMWCTDCQRAYEPGRRARREHRQTFYGYITEEIFSQWRQRLLTFRGSDEVREAIPPLTLRPRPDEAPSDGQARSSHQDA